MARKRPGRPPKSDRARGSSPNPVRRELSPHVATSAGALDDPAIEAPPTSSAQAPIPTPDQEPSNVTERQDDPSGHDPQEFAQLQQLVAAPPTAHALDPQMSDPSSNEPPGQKRRGRRSEAEQVAKKIKDSNGAAVPIDETREEEFHHDGPFTETEKAVIDRFVHTFTDQYNLSQEAFNSLIQNKDRKLDELSRSLWQTLYTVLPKRDHKAMQRHMRRRFHNFNKRGEWSAEEDEQLKCLHQVNPAKWKWIGEQLGRMAEDCRDRWRNYVVCGERRRTDHWDEKEEEELSIAVHDCIRDIKNTAKDRARQQQLAFREDQDWESQINFNNVSAKMKFSRSRLQCLQHWKAIQAREQHHKKKRRMNPTSSTKAKNSDNEKAPRSHYEGSMLPGDKYQMLRDIRDSGVTSEDSIPWSTLAQRSPMKWTVADWRYSWTQLKQLTDNQAEFPMNLTQLMDQFEQEHQGRLEDKYDGSSVKVLQQLAHEAQNGETGGELAIDPTLQNEDLANIDEPVAKTSNKSKRGRKSKRFKSAAVIGSSEPGSPPAPHDAAPQAQMTGYAEQQDRPTNVLEHPSAHFFGKFTSSAPTAPMSQSRDDDHPMDEKEPELPAIRQPFSNDNGQPDGDVAMNAEDHAAAMAAKSMQMLRENRLGENGSSE